MEEISNIKGVKSTALSSMTFQGSNNRGHDVNWRVNNKDVMSSSIL